MSGYHLKEIPKGTLGESSKIKEELEELLDAEDQKNKVMILCELSDIIGAIDLYLYKHFNDTITIEDLVTMQKATKRAFKSGDRK